MSDCYEKFRVSSFEFQVRGAGLRARQSRVRSTHHQYLPLFIFYGWADRPMSNCCYEIKSGGVLLSHAVSSALQGLTAEFGLGSGVAQKISVCLYFHRGCGMPKTQKNCFFSGICAIMPSRRRCGFKNRNFGGFFPDKEFPKPLLKGSGQGRRIISA